MKSLVESIKESIAVNEVALIYFVSQQLEMAVKRISSLWKYGAEWTEDFVEKFIESLDNTSLGGEIVNLDWHKDLTKPKYGFDTSLPIVALQEKKKKKDDAMNLTYLSGIINEFLTKLNIKIEIYNKMAIIGKIADKV